MMKEEFMNMKKLYHYTKFDTAIKILESHSLRFGRLHNMNDVRVLDGGEADEVVHGFISDCEWWIAVGIVLAMDGVIEVVAE